MPSWFDEEVGALKSRSQDLGVRENLVLFYGSSSFTLWTDIERYFPGVAVANHGFGGSTLEDCVEYFDALVATFSPRTVVVYAGDNDLANGATPEMVLQHLDRLIARKRQTMGAIPLAYVSIKVSPARFHIMHRIAYTNLIIERRLQGETDLGFVDITRRMTGRGLYALLGYYSTDLLHMNREGYRVLGKCVSAYLDQLAASGIDLRRGETTAAPAWAEDDGDRCGFPTADRGDGRADGNC